MYGFSTKRLAASITRLTRMGADAGAITRPLTSLAFSGGGGGGTKVAPPLVGVSAVAGPASAASSRHAAASAAQRNSLLELTEGGILFRTPAGLADGLALKELARLPREVRPSGGFDHLGSPAPRYRGFGVPARLPDVSETLRTVELVRIYTNSAGRADLLLGVRDRRGRCSARSSRSSA